LARKREEVHLKKCIVALFAAALSASALAAPSPRELLISQFQQGLPPPVMVAGESPALKSLSARMAELKVPGVSIAVIHEGRIDLARGFGVTRLGGPPVTDRTLFQAASISKPVFALAVLRLMDEGKLNLDTNVNDYLKSWKLPDNDFTSEQKVTLRRLLTHSAGLTVHGFPGYESNAKLPTTLQILDGTPPANTSPIRVDIAPGSLTRYSGGGYTLAQLVVHDVTGLPLPKLLRDSVLTPLGMTQSTYEQPLPAKRLSDVAWPYNGEGEPVPGGPHVYPEMAAAGLWTTPSDLARYALGVRAALAGESKVISSATARAMLTPVMNNQGLGPQVGGKTSRKYFTHGGANEGYRCALLAYEDGEGAVVMTNGDAGDKLLGDVMRTIAHVYQWPDFAPSVRKIADVKPAALDRLVGVYTLNEGSTYVLRREGDQLIGNVLDTPPGVLLPASELELFSRDVDVLVSFTLDDKGAVSAIKHRFNGWERTGTRADEARSRQVMAVMDATAKRFKEQKPLAGSEAAVRELLTSLAAGKPNYERMTPKLADLTRQQLAGLQGFIGSFGPLEKLTFKSVGPEGADIYDAKFEKKLLRIALRVDGEGRIDLVNFLP
jgi:CubicO group peptidase (beta-lactamase class C family)